MSRRTFTLELTGYEMFVLKVAVGDAARWYAEHANGNEWMLKRAQENLDLRAYLDRQLPIETSSNPAPKE